MLLAAALADLGTIVEGLVPAPTYDRSYAQRTLNTFLAQVTARAAIPRLNGEEIGRSTSTVRHPTGEQHGF